MRHSINAGLNDECHPIEFKVRSLNSVLKSSYLDQVKLFHHQSIFIKNGSNLEVHDDSIKLMEARLFLLKKSV